MLARSAKMSRGWRKLKKKLETTWSGMDEPSMSISLPKSSGPCPKCSENISSDFAYCPVCGYHMSLSDGNTPVSDLPVRESETSISRNGQTFGPFSGKRWAWVAAIVGFVALAALVSKSGNEGGSKSVENTPASPRAEETNSRSPQQPMWDKSSAAQEERSKFINQGIRLGVIRRIELTKGFTGNQIADVWVRPPFYTLTYDQKTGARDHDLSISFR
jgi:hypothetical protein